MHVLTRLVLGLSAGTLLLSACSAADVANAIKAGTSSPASSATPAQTSTSSQGFGPSVKQVELKPNATVEVSGNLADGISISDLSWASNSSVACFPATQNSKFKAMHVLFSTKLPTHAVLKIKLIPDDTSKAMSLYAYQIGATRYDVVPNLSSAVSCEADYLNDRPVAGKTEDGTRTVSLNATTNTYNVVVGVSGNADVTGGFKLQFELQQ